MNKLTIQLSNGGFLIHIKSGNESLWLNRENGMKLIEWLPGIISAMPVSINTPPIIHADPEPETYPKGPR